MTGLKLVGIAEIGKLTGTRPETVAQWYKRGKLPEPAARLACGPVWERTVIEQWWGPEPVRQTKPAVVPPAPSPEREVVPRFKGKK